MNIKFLLAVLIAAFLDIADWLLGGWVPFFGDALDVVGIIMLLPFIGIYALLGAVEFIPIVGDLAPSFLVAVFVSRTNLFKLGGKNSGDK